MPKALKLEGKKFNRWTVISQAEIKKPGTYWLCKCECGTIKICKGSDLKIGNTKSCGCLQKANASKYSKKHGLCGTKIYWVWNTMKGRCSNPNDKRFPLYGGRGIKVCEEWKKDFMSFYNWAISNGYKEGLSIDRINNDGNYEPSNCRWVRQIIQSNNTRTNVFLEFNNQRHTVSEWARMLGMSNDGIMWRIKKYGLCKKVFAPCNTKFRNNLCRLHDVANEQSNGMQ